VRLALLIALLVGGLGCAQLRPMLETGCGLLGVGVRVGPSTVNFDLCDVPGIGPETPPVP